MRRFVAAAAAGMTLLSITVATTDASSAAEPATPTPTHVSTGSATPLTLRQSHSELFDVSCPTAKFCLAVGDQVVTSNAPYTTLVEAWDGTAWKVVANTGLPAGVRTLNEVECASATLCFALPDLGISGPHQPVRWTGSRWTRSRMPRPAHDVVSDIACASARFCMAVGWQNSVTASWRWNGAKWRTNPARSPKRSILTGVSCPAVNLCYAAGTYYYPKAPKVRPLVAKWTGRRWTLHAVKDGLPARLYDISCPTKRYCSAVGQSHGGLQAYIATFSGGVWRGYYTTFHLEMGVRPLSEQGAMSISCSAPLHCTIATELLDFNQDMQAWTVGFSIGRIWHLTGTRYKPLYAVSCARRTCTVVGETKDPSVFPFRTWPIKPFVLRGQGAKFHSVPIPAGAG